jgi:phosphoribosylformylglycinamidine synthase PurS subunit
MRLRVHVTPRAGVLDPQGAAVAEGLRHLDFNVGDVRVGKVIDLALPDGVSPEQALATGKAMAEQLLANLVVEDYTVEVLD